MQSYQLSVELPATYWLEKTSTSVYKKLHGGSGAQDSECSVLVLHGFGDRADSARKRLLGPDPIPAWTIFSPNGLFPYPVDRGQGFKGAYAWYFRDLQSGSEMISPEFAAESLLKLMEHLKLLDRNWTILGFSQGGFFAPHLVRAGLVAERLICVGSGFRPEAYKGISLKKVSAIHGADDVVISARHSKADYEKLAALGIEGQFVEFPGLGHTMNDESRALLRNWLG